MGTTGAPPVSAAQLLSSIARYSRPSHPKRRRAAFRTPFQNRRFVRAARPALKKTLYERRPFRVSASYSSPLRSFSRVPIMAGPQRVLVGHQATPMVRETPAAARPPLWLARRWARDRDWSRRRLRLE